MVNIGSALKALLVVLGGGAMLTVFVLDPLLYQVIIVHLIAVPAGMYLLRYRRLNWQSGPVGRALMHMGRAVVILMLVLISGFWFDYRFEEHALGLGRTYIFYAVTYQLLVMSRIKRDTERDALVPPQREASV